MDSSTKKETKKKKWYFILLGTVLSYGIVIVIIFICYATKMFFDQEYTTPGYAEVPIEQWLNAIFYEENHQSLGYFLMVGCSVLAFLGSLVFCLFSFACPRALFKKLHRNRKETANLLIECSIFTIVALFLIGLFSWIFRGIELNLFTFTGNYLGNPIFNFIAVPYVITIICSLPRTVKYITKVMIIPFFEFVKDWYIVILAGALAMGITIALCLACILFIIFVIVALSALCGPHIFFNDLYFAISGVESGKESENANATFSFLFSLALFGASAAIMIPMFLREAGRFVP
jgi:hypothetical protein